MSEFLITVVAVDNQLLMLTALTDIYLPQAMPGAEIVGFRDVADAKDYIRKNRVDLVVTNLWMPEPEIGIGMVKWVKEFFPEVCVSMLTADERPEMMKLGSDAGADYVEEKNYTPELIAKLNMQYRDLVASKWGSRRATD